MPRLNLRNLTKVYARGHHPAVNAFNLEGNDREFLALLGPSGCGKSSTLRMIAGLEEVTSGEIAIDDQPIHRLPPKARRVGLAFENYALYPPLSVRENLTFNLQASRLAPAEIDSRVERIARLMNISDLLAAKPGNLSGGQKQRVNIARAIIREPALLLLDEPLNHLDATMRIQLQAEIKRLHAQIGCTTILVTHDQLEAMSMADRIAVLNDGVLQQIGTPQEVFNRPRNEFVAGFIGDPPMNIFRVEPAAGGAALTVPGTGFHLALDETAARTLAGVGPVKLGIRPHRVQVGSAPQPDSVPGTVAVAEHLGDETRLMVRYGEVEVLAALPLNRRLQGGLPVHLRFPAAHRNFFRVEGGERVVLPAAAGAPPAGPAPAPAAALPAAVAS